MKYPDPLKKTKSSYARVIKKIALPESSVGIDAQLTHAIVIDYLQQLSDRLSKIEKKLTS